MINLKYTNIIKKSTEDVRNMEGVNKRKQQGERSFQRKQIFILFREPCSLFKNLQSYLFIC